MTRQKDEGGGRKCNLFINKKNVHSSFIISTWAITKLCIKSRTAEGYEVKHK